MEPGVPFALLGAVQVLLVVAGVGLAAAAALTRSSAGAVLAVGGALLAAVEVRTSLRVGVSASDGLALARAGALLLIAVGLYTGGLAERRLPLVLPGIVVPLAAMGNLAALTATAALVAAGAAFARHRDLVGQALGAGFLFWAVAALVSPAAVDSADAAVATTALRGAGALAIMFALALLAQASLLSKVVAAILAGVVAMAVASVGVIGSVVVASYDRQTRDTILSAATSRLTALQDLGPTVEARAGSAALVCPQGARACGVYFGLVQAGSSFLIKVPRSGAPVVQGASAGVNLSPASVVGLRGLPVVQTVLSSKAGAGDLLSDNVRLVGSSSGLAVVAAAAGRRTTPDAPPSEVWVYGIAIDSEYARRDLDLGGFGLHLLSGDPLAVTASNRSLAEQDQLLKIVQRETASGAVPQDGLSVGSQGSQPTVAVLPVQARDRSSVALLAMTRDAGPALQTERDALRLLLLTVLGALAAVAAVAVVMGRRTIDPVRQLTAAAERVAAGDLTTRVGVTTRDEVGTLTATFDAMTGSLLRLTDDLRSSADRLGTVLTTMTDGLLATDEDGLVTSVNRAALEMLGVHEPDVLGEPLEFVVDVRAETGESLLQPHLTPHETPGTVHRPDGSKVAVRVTTLPLAEGDGIVLVLRDTTREREVERMKTEFLSNVSHELRTPLTPIRGYAELLVGKPGLESSQVAAFASTIRDESLKLNRVVDLLVDVAALEAGRVQVTAHPTDMRSLLDVRLSAWQQRVPERAGDFRRRAAATLPKAMVDPIWLGKALDELIDNAVKYTPPGTTISLTATVAPSGGRLRVSVKDSGPGISAADQERMFTSFEQVDGSATRRVGGLGLGLSFVRRLAEEAGFPLSVVSHPGRGSEFSLDLPLVTPEGKRARR
jgi:PAS domain S-box-containing protein